MIIVVFISFIMSLFVAIQDPVIQNFAIRIAGGYLSNKTGADVKIGRLYITPDFSIHLQNLSLKDLKGNDLLYAEELVARPLMEDIINGDINIDKVKLVNAKANLITYEGEEHMNLQFLIDAFATDTEKKKDKKIPININRILVEDLDFQFWNQNKDTLKGRDSTLMNYAHIAVNDIHLDVEDLFINGDSITAVLNNLAAKEQSGFILQQMASKISVSSKGIHLDDLLLDTKNSHLDLDLHMDYPGYHAFKSFVDSVSFNNNIRNSEILLSDIGPFTQVLYDMPNRLKLEGKMNGPVKDFELKQLKVRYGDVTRIEGDIALQPIDFLHGNQSIKLKKVTYSYDDLVKFRLPGPSKTLPIPEALKSIGQGTISGNFNGSMDRFAADLDVTSEIGNLTLDIDKYINDQRHDVYEGFVSAEKLDIGKLANASKVIGTINLESNIICRIGKDKDIDLDIDGNAYNAILLSNSVDEISMNGNLHKNQFNGKLSVDDDELDLDFMGRFDFSNPKSLGGDFTAKINSADLNKLNIIKDDPEASLSAVITADMTSINNFNDAVGNLNISDLVFNNSKGAFTMDELNAHIVNDNLLQKKINLDCDYLNAEMAGKMDFSTLAIAFKQFVNSYVQIPQWEEELEAFEESGKSSDQDFIVQLNLTNPKPITEFFAPSITVAKNTYVNGTFTSRAQMLNLTMRSKQLKINNIKINNIECRSQSSPRRCMTRLHLDNIILRDSTEKNPSVLGLDDFSIVNNLRNDSILTDILWDNHAVNNLNKASIRTAYLPDREGGDFNIYEGNLWLHDTLWLFNPVNAIAIDSGRIQLTNMELFNNNQSIKIEGTIPNTVNDTLYASFKAFNLGNLNFLFGGKDIKLDGLLNGKAQVSNIKEDLSLLADLDIDGLGLNDETFGDAHVESYWDNLDESVNIDLSLIDQGQKAIDLTGAYYTTREKDNLDFKLGLDSLNLSMLNPFTRGIAERIQGHAHGGVIVKGELNRPQIDGSVKIEDGGCKIDFLNTFYTFSPTILISDSLISLKDMIMTDTLGHTARVTGGVSHNHLKDLYLDVKMFPNNFLAMATSAANSPTFYGTAIASGIIEATGPFNDLDLRIRARTRKGTVMTIPIGGKNSVKKHDFITFVEHKAPSEDEDELIEEETKKSPNNFNIGMDLSVDPDAQIKISLPNGLGSMEAKGEGNLRLGVNRNDLSLYGEYIISEGNLSLNIQDLIKKNFTLDPGSSISWTGDPVKGTINATGVYHTKASLASLGLADSTSMSNTNVKVECLVRLRNQLLNPDITFGIRLPNASEDLQQAVFSVIDTTNQSTVFTQALYLLAFNSFSYGENLDGYGLISGQLTDFVSEFVDDLDINFNYKPGSEWNNEEMTVAFKKQLLNDRLTIETNFGVIIPTNNYANNSNTIVGDVNVDYKITPDGRFSVQVFNRSNYNTMYYQYSYYKMAPYTQGIGLSYNKSFDHFKDIFKKQSNFPRPNRPLINRTNQDHDREPSN